MLASSYKRCQNQIRRGVRKAAFMGSSNARLSVVNNGRKRIFGATTLAIVAIGGCLTAASSAAEPETTGVQRDHVGCTGASQEIEVTITGVKRSVGLMVVELYPDDPKVFLNGKGRLAIVRRAARAPQTVICLHAPEPGRYAVSVYQDVNANTDFDTGLFGLPKEPWGLSNNPKVHFHAPRLSDSLFDAPQAGVRLQIRLR